MNPSPFAGARVLITGASAGLGEEFARQLAFLKVSQIVLTARRQERLLKLQTLLMDVAPGIKVNCVTADLSQPDGANGLIKALEEANVYPDVIINNAGFGDLGLFESSERAKVESMLLLNVVALTQLCHWALPRMLAAKKGWICNVGSTAGITPFLPTFAVYGATKAYVNSFSEALRVECLGSGVHVSVLAPGPVETEFGEVAGRANSKRQFEAPAFLMVHKADVVGQAISGLARNQARVVPGLLVRIGALIVETVPTWIIRIVFGLQSGAFVQERAKHQRDAGSKPT